MDEQKITVDVELNTTKAEKQIERLTEKTGKELSTAFNKANAIYEEKKLKDAEERFKKLQAAMDKAFASPANVLKGIGGGITERITKPFGKLGETIADINRRFSKFTAAIARVTIYRAIRKVIKDITQGIREGVQNLYQYSQIIGTEFAPSLDRMASGALFIKNAFAAMVAPLVNFVAPTIERIARLIGEASNRMAEFFAILTNGAKAQYTKAIWYTKKYQDAAKQAKKSLDLLGIDEINRLTDNSGSGNGDDYAQMFEEAIAGEGGDFASSLADSIANGDWDSVGRVIAEKLNSILETINSSDIAVKIGEKFNNAITALSSFIETFDWQGVSSTVVKKLQELDLDWKTIGEAWASRITIVGDLFIGALETIDWAQVGTAIGEFLQGQLEALTKWIQKVDWFKLGQDVFDGFVTLIKSINVAELIGDFGRLFDSLLQGVGAWIAGLWTSFKEWAKGLFGGSNVGNFAATGATSRNALSASDISKHKNNDIGSTLDKLAMLDRYNTGGFPKNGDLFWANEGKPELVGSLNGRAYVGSNSDINSVGTGIENAVYAMANMVVQAIERKDTTVSLDGDKLSKAVSNRQNLAALARG